MYKVKHCNMEEFLAELKAIAKQYKWIDGLKGLRAIAHESMQTHPLCPITALYHSKTGKYHKASEIFTEHIDQKLGIENIALSICQAADGSEGYSEAIQLLSKQLRKITNPK